MNPTNFLLHPHVLSDPLLDPARALLLRIHQPDQNSYDTYDTKYDTNDTNDTYPEVFDFVHHHIILSNGKKVPMRITKMIDVSLEENVPLLTENVETMLKQCQNQRSTWLHCYWVPPTKAIWNNWWPRRRFQPTRDLRVGPDTEFVYKDLQIMATWWQIPLILPSGKWIES